MHGPHINRSAKWFDCTGTLMVQQEKDNVRYKNVHTLNLGRTTDISCILFYRS